MSPARLSLPLFALTVAAALPACDGEESQFVVSGTLVSVPAEAIRTGDVNVSVIRHDIDRNVEDVRNLPTTADGVFGWPAPIDDAGANVEYTVIAQAPGATPVIEFAIPAEAADEGRFILPEMPVWKLAAKIAATTDGAQLTWADAPEEIEVLGYDIEVIGTVDDHHQVLWRQAFADGAQRRVNLPAYRLEDFDVRASVVATVATEGTVSTLTLASDEAALGNGQALAMPLTRGAQCTVEGHETCPFADGALEVVRLDDASIVIALPETVEIDTIVVRGLVTDLGTEVVVEVNDGRSRLFEAFAKEIVDTQPFFFDVKSRTPYQVRRIRLRAVDSEPSEFALAEISGF